MEFPDRCLETAQHRLGGTSCVESIESFPLDVLEEWRRRALPDFDSSYLELVLANDFSDVLRQCAGVTLALRNEPNPVVVSFVFESDLDGLRNFRRECIKVLPLTIDDIRVEGLLNRIDDTVNDTPTVGFQALFRRQQNFANERVDRLVAFDSF